MSLQIPANLNHFKIKGSFFFFNVMGRDSEYRSTWSKTVKWVGCCAKISSVSRPKDIPEERDEVSYLSRFKISIKSR